jgi:hypothetical protein
MTSSAGAAAKYFLRAIGEAGVRPPDTAQQHLKKNYAEKLSNTVALAIAERLRELGLPGCAPDPKTGGRERQFAGGIGAKKVDVSFATESDGLILAVSIKSICFPDAKTKNFQKNLTNRRGDLLAEATTLHQRFPYAVVGGLFLLDRRAAADATDRRVSTFETAHEFFKTFDGRGTQTNAVERFEVLGIALFDPNPPAVIYFDAGKGGDEKSLDAFLERLLVRIAERNPDRFRFVGGKIEKRSGPPKKGKDLNVTEGDEDSDE